MSESSRIRKLKVQLIKELPFFPNTNEIKKDLEKKTLQEVLHAYLSWQMRCITPLPRKTYLDSTVTSDRRWESLKESINILLKKASNGEDLNPYLSENVKTRSYTSKNHRTLKNMDCWEDKDQILNTLGYHHFHLDMQNKSDGLSKRTNEVLFALLTDKIFKAIAITDHSVFDSSTDSLTGIYVQEERERLWNIHLEEASFLDGDSRAYLPAPLSASGHHIEMLRLSIKYADQINNLDHKLTDREFVNHLYEQGKLLIPPKFKLEWRIHYLDLHIYDRKNDQIFRISN